MTPLLIMPTIVISAVNTYPIKYMYVMNAMISIFVGNVQWIIITSRNSMNINYMKYLVPIPNRWINQSLKYVELYSLHNVYVNKCNY